MLVSRTNSGMLMKAIYATALTAAYFAASLSHAQVVVIAAQSFEGNSTTSDLYFDDTGTLGFGDNARLNPDGGDPLEGWSLNFESQFTELVETTDTNNLIFQVEETPGGQQVTLDGAPVFDFVGTATGRVFDGPATQTVIPFQNAVPTEDGEGNLTGQPSVTPQAAVTVPSIPWTLRWTSSRLNDEFILLQVANEAVDFIQDIDDGRIVDTIDVTTGAVTLRTLPAGVTTAVTEDDIFNTLTTADLPLIDGNDPAAGIFDATVITGPASAPVPDGAIVSVDVNGTTLDTSFINVTQSTGSGDYNYDGLVTAADLDVWRDNFGASTANATGVSFVNPFNGETVLVADGNLDDDGQVNGADYALLRNNLGANVRDFVDIDDTNGLTGESLTDGDLVGVISDPVVISAAVGPGGSASLAAEDTLSPFDGSNLLVVSDPDGSIWLELDAVDVSSFSDIGVLFDFNVNNTGFESTSQPDFIVLYANGTEVFRIGELESVVNGQTVAFGLEDTDGFFQLDSLVNIDSSLITDGTLQLTFVLDSSSNAENYAIDNIRIFGTSSTSALTAVPEPGIVAIPTALLIVGCRRKAKSLQ